MREALKRLWYGNAPLAALLAPLAWFYGAVMFLRRRVYSAGVLRQYRLGCPVVVVGNLVVGGTGKTPLVAWLALQLKARGYRVGIISRGYGRRGRAARLVTPDASWQEVGDEPLLLARRTGCMTAVGADRVAAAQLLGAQGVNVIVSDDGLQHLRMAPNCRVVVVDAERGFGNGRLLPAGPLREPVAQLAAADAIVVNGLNASASLLDLCEGFAAPVVQMQLVSGAAISVCAGQARELASFRGRTVHGVAGIGNPARFFRELRRVGLEVIEHPFADHHPMVASDLDFGDDLPVLMTEKDAVKCAGFADTRLWYVPVTAEIKVAHVNEFLALVLGRLQTPLR